jgi:hypothetical protein
LYPRPFGKSGKSSSSKSGKAKTLKSSSKSGKSAKHGDKDNYKGLFGDYQRVNAPLQKQGFEVSHSSKSSASNSMSSLGGYWLPIVTACVLGVFSVFAIEL